MKTRKIIILLILIPFIAWSATTVGAVEKNLMCTCGCTMPLYTCECDTSAKIRKQIQAMIDKGMDKDQIIAAYVSQYGEKILSAPTKSGFNLMAWVMPFLALFVVSGILYKVVRRWSSATAVQEVEILSPDVEKKYAEKLKKDLANIEEGDMA